MTSSYVIRKYNSGWVVSDPKNDQTNFLSNQDLIEKGWIAPESKVVVPPASAPRVIIVPSGGRPRSSSLGRADRSENWRERGMKSNSAPTPSLMKR